MIEFAESHAAVAHPWLVVGLALVIVASFALACVSWRR